MNFIEAVKRGDAESVRAMLASRAVDPAVNNNEALRRAACSGHIEVVKCLLGCLVVRENAAASDMLGPNAALRLAAGNGHLEVVNCLLEISAVREAVTCSELYWAARECHFEVVKRLVGLPAVREHASFAQLCEKYPIIFVCVRMKQPNIAGIYNQFNGPAAPSRKRKRGEDEGQVINRLRS